MSKHKVTLFIIFLLLFTSCGTTGEYIQADNIVELEITFANPIWNGQIIPEGEKCTACGENGSSPSIVVENIPENANALILYFQEGRPLNLNPNYIEGTNGVIGYNISPAKEKVQVPSVSGLSRTLPENFFQVRPPTKQVMGQTAAYLPPCNCRGRDWYFIHVKAVYLPSAEDADSYELGSGNITMGRTQ